jgi:mono/diheme cytochrome c family protein
MSRLLNRVNNRTLPALTVRSVFAHPFAQAIIIELLAYLLFVYGLPFIAGLATGNPAPTPASILTFYMGITTAVVLLYISSNEETWRQFKRPIVTVLTEQENQSVAITRWAILILLPLLAGYQAYAALQKTVEAPAELRSIHPAPPTTIQFKGKTLNIQGLNNPLRDDQANLDKNTQAGAAVYATHCVFCHGDAQNGQGIFAQNINPQPANFADPGTIAQLQESYLFWRVAKGGPGLPTESAPWNSSMPAWEDKLSEEEIWQVILYLYHATGYSPRTWQ